MAIDFLLSKEGDIDITNDTMTLTQTIEQSSLQQVLITLQGFRGEWVFNTEAYPPYLENDNNPIQILGKSSQAIFDFYIKEAILGTENITEILSYESRLDKPARESTISFSARTNSGEVISIDDLAVA